MDLPHLLAVDIGGTKTATAVMTPDGRILSLNQAPTALSEPSALVDQIADLLTEVQQSAGVSAKAALALGVGIPAVLSADHKVIVWAPNLPGWKGIPLHAELASRVHLPVCLEYDGHTAVLGEWWQGVAKGYSSVVSVIVGTGIGAGMVLGGRLYRGRDGIAGAAGWFALTSDPRLPIDSETRSLGHWESLAAGPAIASRLREALRSGEHSVLAQFANDREVTAKDVFDAARSGDELSSRIIRQAAEILGLGVANIISLVNPEIVVLGGSIGRQADLVLEPVRRTVQLWAQPISRNVEIVSSTLNENAGLLGAGYAALSVTREFSK